MRGGKTDNRNGPRFAFCFLRFVFCFAREEEWGPLVWCVRLCGVWEGMPPVKYTCREGGSRSRDGAGEGRRGLRRGRTRLLRRLEQSAHLGGGGTALRGDLDEGQQKADQVVSVPCDAEEEGRGDQAPAASPGLRLVAAIGPPLPG